MPDETSHANQASAPFNPEAMKNQFRKAIHGGNGNPVSRADIELLSTFPWPPLRLRAAGTFVEGACSTYTALMPELAEQNAARVVARFAPLCE